MGISEDMAIVVYDGMGLFSAPRVRWTFKVFGAKDVRILDGGFPKWTAEGRPVETGAPPDHAPRTFRATFDASAVASMADVKAALGDGRQVVDARPAGRFAGVDPEPRPGLPSGHMPGSRNVPFATLVENGRLKDEAGIAAALAAGGVDPDKPMITSCGSGVSAAIISTALELIGKPAEKLYDGSGPNGPPSPTPTSPPRRAEPWPAAAAGSATMAARLWWSASMSRNGAGAASERSSGGSGPAGAAGAVLPTR